MLHKTLIFSSYQLSLDFNFFVQGIKQHARKTCPEGIYVDTSSIRNSGEGIWTRKDIEKNTVFGPYTGEKIHRKDVKNLRKVMEGGYSWEVIYLCLNASFKC